MKEVEVVTDGVVRGREVHKEGHRDLLGKYPCHSLPHHESPNPCLLVPSDGPESEPQRNRDPVSLGTALTGVGNP